MDVPRVAIQYPTAHRDVFEPLTDFEVWDMSLVVPDCMPEREFWLDFSKGDLQSGPLPYRAMAHICETFDDPDRNVLNVARRQCRDHTTVGIWRGERRHLKLMSEACDIVALPYYEYGRMSYVPDGESHKYHLYEFCSLDELRRYPIRSIHTSVPITAALVGIDLRTRERRPKRLPPFTYDLRLSDAQLDLAVQNTLAIREAVYGHYPDTNPKT